MPGGLGLGLGLGLALSRGLGLGLGLGLLSRGLGLGLGLGLALGLALSWRESARAALSLYWRAYSSGSTSSGCVTMIRCAVPAAARCMLDRGG